MADETWELHERTRQKLNICNLCGKPREMYYQPWCPRCDKPQAQFLTAFNFVQCLRHLEVKGNEGIKDRIWRHFEHQIHNDCYLNLWIPSESEAKEYHEQSVKDLWLLADTFGLKKGDATLFRVSW
jgi:hypothetical protein